MATRYWGTLPERNIFQGVLNGFNLEEVTNLLTPQQFPTTAQGHVVTGYENPWYVRSNQNHFVKGEVGLLCDQFYLTPDGEKSAIVYVDYAVTRTPRAVLTGDELVEAGLVVSSENVELGKAIVFSHGQRVYMLFNYVGATRPGALAFCNIGTCELRGGQAYNVQSFWGASDRVLAGIGLCDAPLLVDGKFYLLTNRCSSIGGEFVYGVSFGELGFEEGDLRILHAGFEETWVLPSDEAEPLVSGPYEGVRVNFGTYFAAILASATANFEFFASESPNKAFVGYLK